MTPSGEKLLLLPTPTLLMVYLLPTMSPVSSLGKTTNTACSATPEMILIYGRFEVVADSLHTWDCGRIRREVACRGGMGDEDWLGMEDLGTAYS